MNMFENAVRNKYRFDYKGSISVEALWDLNVNALDLIYKKLVKEVKDNEEESLLSPINKENEELENKVEIIKYIVDVKLREKALRLESKERAAKKQELLEIIKDKENEKLRNMSADDLKKMVDEL